MLIIPAIDLQGGRVVRLVRGVFSTETVYHDDPLAVARRWFGEGARYLHVVDLDGARTGAIQHQAAIHEIAAEAAKVGAKVEVGGGVRSAEVIEELLQQGVDRVVLGTKAFEDARFRQAVLRRHGDRIAIAVDSHSGSVVTQGWTVANVNASTFHDTEATFVAALLNDGARYIIYTEVTKDGTLAGPALDGVQRMLDQVAGKAQVIASGGVGSIEHLQQLLALSPAPYGVIVGKALYDGRIELAKALALAG
ncbi:MAG: 1-(5-phosphoribosyl)-5-[(5-phosphoribosylamino)methylideneamino] imidazole-4-carboxamide isomerase [Candidatus Omnitrophica bacterium]|nr:1-(5-phosphoribosyl)-5-[(5-phosphoribosylamino)methylideneamino] imidazole-4-carboxamide isomerase [Candidatus Omnitrophota bacterium]